MNLTLANIGAEGATAFFASNSSGAVFHHPEVAQTLANGCEWWLVSKGSEPFQLFPTCKDEEGNAKLPPFSYYFGPYWSDTFLARPTSSKFSDSQKIYKLVLHHLFENCKTFQLEFQHSETDMRPFLWWNYDNLHPRLCIVPRYSAVVQNLQLKSHEDLQAGFRSVRRQEIKKAKKGEGFTFSDNIDWREIESGYSRAIERSGSAPSEGDMEALGRLLKSDLATGWGAIDDHSGALASYTLTLRAKGTTHLVLAFTDRDYRNSGIGPLSIQEAIFRAKYAGDTSFDFDGANSPLRGDDKHSYGARPALYFRVDSCPS